MTTFLYLKVARFLNLNREEGQTMAEYGVVLAVITVALIAAFGLLSTEIKNAIDEVRKALPG